LTERFQSDKKAYRVNSYLMRWSSANNLQSATLPDTLASDL
jgi:hypothetical protein